MPETTASLSDTGPVPNLANLRRQLDAVDNDLINTLARRMHLIRQTAELKAMTTDQVRDSLREEEMLDRLAHRATDAGLPPYFVTAIYREILDYSVRCQGDRLVGEVRTDTPKEAKQLRVGYQGVAGAYSSKAGQHHFQEAAETLEFVGFPTFRELLESVDQGRIDRAMLPIENTTAGSINEAYDLLASLPLSVVGEEILEIDHCLVVLDPSVTPGDIRRITSHPQALAQCTDYLGTLSGVEIRPGVDTALSVAEVRERGDRTHAAIASREAATHYGGHVLRQGLANQKNNYTRFLVVSKTPVRVDSRVPCKTSILFQVAHQPGALLGCLSILERHSINLAKLESRPVLDSPWTYRFYVDLEANLEAEDVQSALRELSNSTVTLRVLGCYPRR